MKDQCLKLKKEKGKDKVKAKSKVRNLKATWDDTTSSSKAVYGGMCHKVGIAFMAIDDGIGTSSNEESYVRLREEGAIPYESNGTENEVTNLPLEKLYDAIKLLSIFTQS